MEIQTRPYEEGKAAYYQGKGTLENPYDIIGNPRAFLEWRSGWEEAESQDCVFLADMCDMDDGA